MHVNIFFHHVSGAPFHVQQSLGLFMNPTPYFEVLGGRETLYGVLLRKKLQVCIWCSSRPFFRPILPVLPDPLVPLHPIHFPLFHPFRLPCVPSSACPLAPSLRPTLHPVPPPVTPPIPPPHRRPFRPSTRLRRRPEKIVGNPSSWLLAEAVRPQQ